jgi:hypothetical protein
MTQFLADKMTAITEELRKQADASGYGSFISAEKIQESAAAIVSRISEVEQKYGFVPLHQDGTLTTQVDKPVPAPAPEQEAATDAQPQEGSAVPDTI